MVTRDDRTQGGAALTAVRDWIAAARDQLYTLDETTLPELFEELLALAAGAQGLAVGVLMETMSRGVIDSSTATGVAGWVRDRGLAAGVQVTGADAAAWAAVAEQAARPDMPVYADAVVTGRVSIAGGAVLGKELRKIRDHVSAATWDACAAEVIDYAATVAAPARRLPELRDILISQYGDDPEHLLKKERQAYADREVTRFRREPGGMLGLHVRCDPASAAVIETVLEALAAPNPARCSDPDTAQVAARDPRTAGQRRFDALLDLCHAYADHPDVTDNARTGAANRTQVVITMDWEGLRDQCGYGLTAFGQPLSPQTVRAFACDAQVIPMVLGGRGEILDQGRAERTATAAQWANLRHRDKGCTFPGCDRPPGYCQAHHIRWWDRHHGRTDIDNLTLVCHRHHQVIHRDGYTAEVTPAGVVWWREELPLLRVAS